MPSKDYLKYNDMEGPLPCLATGIAQYQLVIAARMVSLTSAALVPYPRDTFQSSGMRYNMLQHNTACCNMVQHVAT